MSDYSLNRSSICDDLPEDRCRRRRRQCVYITDYYPYVEGGRKYCRSRAGFVVYWRGQPAAAPGAGVPPR